MSFTATNSMAGAPSEARKMLRPMRPNPLIPTLIGMLPPRCGGDSSAQQDRTERKPEAKQTMLGRVWEKVKPSEPREPRAGRQLGVLLDADDLVARESHEDSLLRRLAVDPFLGFRAVGIAFADLAFRLPDRRDDHIAIHPHHGPLFLDGLLEFWREGLHPLHRGGTLLGEIKHGDQMVLEFVWSHVRERASEVEEEGCADPLIAWCGVGVGGGYRRRGHTAHLDLDFVAPACFAPPASVQVKHDLVVAELELRHLHRVARAHRRAIRGHQLLQHLLIQRLAHFDPKALLSGGQRLQGPGELTRDVANKLQPRLWLQLCGFRGGRLLLRCPRDAWKQRP